MMMKTPFILSMVGILALSACDVDPYAYPNDPNARQKTGAVAGAVIGGVIGAQGEGNKVAQTALGATVGALVGAGIGNSLDQQAADLRNSLGNANITVTNMGDYLIVNMPQDLLFATDSATLRSDLTSDLRAVASNLVAYPNSTIQVIGHTDNQGSAAYNQDLSQRRAVAVTDVLAGAGVPYGRMSAIGRGEDQPIASNLSPEGMAQNRRVEIIIRPNA